ncbi:unnamed protein product [Cercopithifilaria johnstoni]|uniref:Uncharacterized protein n=1 Tax=Cercopithifilaria johnstoni TaxID=2874296 RepID=A0A8J2M109_9BILA|nr:unnamed protein product [Cercopithifilaria johnstoni]
MLPSLVRKMVCCSVQTGNLLKKGYRTRSNFNRQRRLELFCSELKRQARVYEKKVEKVFWTIESEADSDPVKVLMNRNISTYRDCMKHISRLKADRMALAYANGSYKSVLEKLSGNGKMTPLDYKCQNKHHANAVNMAYWRTCAFLLGAVIDRAFAVDVQLVGPSKVDYHSGRFEYIARIENQENWTPNSENLFALTEKAIGEYIAKPLVVEPLLVSLEFAVDLFDSNVWKQKLVHEVKHETEDGKQGVIIYRMGDFVDLTYGPLIPHTSHIDKFALTKVEQEGSEYCFVGVSVPKELKCSSYSWDLICNASVMPPVKRRKLLEAFI